MSQALIDAAWHAGRLKYKLYPLQKQVYDRIRSANALWTFLECGRGWAKTSLMGLMAMEDTIRNTSYPFAFIGPEIKQQTRIMNHFLAKFAADAPPGLIKRRRSEAEIEIGGNILYIAGFNRDSIERLRGLRLGGVYIDEARDCDAEQFLYGLHDVIIPTLAHANGRIVVGSSTPEPLDHPLINYVAVQAALSDTHFVYTIDDNPTLTEPQKASLIEAMGGKDSDAVQRELYCKRIRPKSRVVLTDYAASWEEQDPNHIRHGNWLIFGDVGGVRDKTWIGVGYYDVPTASLYVVDERFWDENTPSGVIATGIGQLKSHVPESFDEIHHRIDMPGQMLVDYRDIHKMQISMPVKLEFNQSINKLNMAFRSGRIKIHPRCKMLRMCCEYGLLNKNRTDFERTPTFGHCDPLAGLKYGWSSCDKDTNRWPIASSTILPKHMQKQTASQTLSGLLAGGRRS